MKLLTRLAAAAFLTVLGVPAAQAGVQATLYAAPNGGGTACTSDQPCSLAQAQSEVQAQNQNMSGDIVVYLQGGTYQLSSTWQLGTADSGTNGNNVIYQAAPGQMPVLSGGVPVGGWSDAGGGLYQTNVGSRNFRQLYVNGRRAMRARSPLGSFNRLISWQPGGHTVTINAGEIAAWNNLKNVEMVVARPSDVTRARIDHYTVNGSQAVITFQEPDATRAFATAGYTRFANQAYYFENAREFVTGPGEWYLNASTGDLYYRPRPGEDMGTASVVVPQLETLVSVNGSVYDTWRVSQAVQNIQFVGLTFAYSTWTRPSAEGFAGTQAGQFKTDGTGLGVPPAAVSLTGAQNIVFERNTFCHLGAEGLGLQISTNNNLIEGNLIYDASGNGISLNRVALQDVPAYSVSDHVRDNVITQTALDYWGGVGIYASFADGLLVEHNEVSDVPQTGISVGWGWTADVLAPPQQNNLIQNNSVHDFCTLLCDGGGVYLNSRQNGTQALNNWTHEARRSQWAHVFPISGLYLDNGSGGETVQNNVLEDLDGQNGQTGETLLDQFGNPSDNTLTPNYGPADGPAAGIVAGAGLEPGYRDVKFGLPNLVINPGFEEDQASVGLPVGWSLWSPNGSGDFDAAFTENLGVSHDGIFHLANWKNSPYTIDTYQYLTGLPNGTYTLSAWVEGSSAQIGSMYVKGYTAGNYDAGMSAPIPQTGAGAGDWQPISIPNIPISSGVLELGFITQDNAGGNWVRVDDVQLYDPPAAPTALKAFAGNASVALFWAATPSASSYTLYRATTSGAETVYKTGLSGTKYTDAGVSNGAAYYYKIAAFGHGHAGAPSVEAFARPIAPPGAPGGLSATAGAPGRKSITVKWSPVSEATGFVLFRATSSAGTYHQIGATTGTSYTNSRLTAGTTCFYKAAATNAGGTSGLSNAVSAKAQ